ncbi:MAG: alkaline phosphatase D family protein [Myxococcota bacterium]
MERLPGFDAPLLSDAVGAGAVDKNTARIWFRSSRGGRHRIVYWPSTRPNDTWSQEFESFPDCGTDGTGVVVLRDGLCAGGEYHYVIEALDPKHHVGSGVFETPPADGKSVGKTFSFGLMSCHMPFTADGGVATKNLRVLDQAPSILESERCKRLLWVGDQMYSELPAALSLSAPRYLARVSPQVTPHTLSARSREEIRWLYQTRYRLFWGFDAIRSLMRSWPGHYMWDDHELVDNFGTDPAHHTEAWRPVREGASDAFFDYQGSRALSRSTWRAQRSFHHSFRYGPISVFLMDLRSNKRRSGAQAIQFYEQHQFDDLRSFLNGNREAHVVVIVLSVPIFRGPIDLVARRVESSAVDDNWASALATESREQLLTLFRQHAQTTQQKLVFLSGDIHSASASRIDWTDPSRRGARRDRSIPPAYEFVSSPITHGRPDYRKFAFVPFRHRDRKIRIDGNVVARVSLVPGQGHTRKNPCLRNNLGVVQFEVHEHRTDVRFKVYGATSAGVRPVYVSPPL